MLIWDDYFHALHSNECPGYDTKQSNGEAPVMLELWGMRSTPSFASLPGSLWLGVVALDRVLSIGRIELFDTEPERKQRTYWGKLLEIELFDHLTVCIYKMSLQIIYLIYMQKYDLTLHNQQWWICYKTKPDKTFAVHTL